MSVSLFSRPYSSVGAPRCALGLSLCRPSETTYCLFEPFKYNHVAFAYFSFLSNPLLHRSCHPLVESVLPHASFEHSAEYHSHVGLDHACISNVVICPTCIQTNGSFEVSLCLHYVSLRILLLTSHSVHAPTHVDEIDRCSEINCMSCKEIKVWSVSMIEMTRGGVCGDQREYIVCS